MKKLTVLFFLFYTSFSFSQPLKLNWELVPFLPPPIEAMCMKENKLYASTKFGVYLSQDTGKTWILQHKQVPETYDYAGFTAYTLKETGMFILKKTDGSNSRRNTGNAIFFDSPHS